VTFAHPDRLLLAAAAVAVFIVLYRRIERSARRQALTYSSLPFALAALRPRALPSALLFAALVAGVCALGAAFAGPRIAVRVPAKDATVMLCIDTSGSMRALDVAPTRIAAAKAAARAFIDAVPAGTRIGIVTFATGASVIQQPTDDLDEVRAALARVPLPNGATAIGDALALAAQQMPEHGTRAIVLLTDGVNNRGADPLAVAREVAAAGIAIHTVGVGTAGSGQLIPGTDEPADLDEDTLRAIAEATRGTYSPARDAGQLSAVFRGLAGVTVWERKRVDGSAVFAAGGGTIVLLAFLAGFALGKFP
jgi:Ca-activated chloride channel family protein